MLIKFFRSTPSFGSPNREQERRDEKKKGRKIIFPRAIESSYIVDNDFLVGKGKEGKRGLHLTEEDRSLSYISNVRDDIRTLFLNLCISRRETRLEIHPSPLFLFESNNRLADCRLQVQGQQGLSLARWREPLHPVSGEREPDDLRAEGESLWRGTIFLSGEERYHHPRRGYHARRPRFVYRNFPKNNIPHFSYKNIIKHDRIPWKGWTRSDGKRNSKAWRNAVRQTFLVRMG